MTMATLGLAAEFAKAGIAANTLWPRTTIATAAVQFALGGDTHDEGRAARPRSTRMPRTRSSLKPSREYTGQTLIVEDVLTDAGITDFSGYAAVPGTPDDQLFPDIFLN